MTRAETALVPDLEPVPSPKRLVLDLLSSVRGRALAVALLVDAGALFDLQPNGVRVALARLRARGLVESPERGRYRLAPGAEPVQQRVLAWRKRAPVHARWDGRWCGMLVPTAAQAGRAASERNERLLRFVGARPFDGPLWLRPDNQPGGVAATRERLRGLGLADDVPVLAISDLDADAERRARALWDGAALARGHARLRRALERSARALPRLDERTAMVETYRLGGAAIRRLTLDPDLPEAIAPRAERDALAEVARRYDRLGRAAWRPFMEAHGAVPDRAPSHRPPGPTEPGAAPLRNTA